MTIWVNPGFHSLRNEYGADLVSMFTSTHDVGGIAWMQISRNPEPYYGYSITRVQQAATSATHVHEMGHNMGSAHIMPHFVHVGGTGCRLLNPRNRNGA